MGFWILTFLGRVPKKHPKNFSREKFDLQVFPHFLSNQCPMNLLPSCILMVRNLTQGKTLLKSTDLKCSEHKAKCFVSRPVCESW